MVDSPSLKERDHKHIWHPFTPWTKDSYNVPIVKGKGSFLFDEHGNRYIDAVSSWWVNIHGHAHPYIAQKMYEQFMLLEHVIFAGYTHPKAIELAERLLQKLPPTQKKLFFSDNGSTSVEVAIKIAIQYRHNRSESHHRIIAFEHSYHGDTFGAMSASGRSIFTDVFSDLLFDVIHIPVPIAGQEEQCMEALKKALKKESVTAFIFEPLILGAGGMMMYEAKILDQLIDCCHQNGVLCIADEVMTGFGRTGTFFASDTLHHHPDIFCLSKGITGGVMPLGVTTVSESVYSAFESEQPEHTLWHGHSYTANPLACAAACASLDLFESEKTMCNVKQIAALFQLKKESIQSPFFSNIRTLGGIFALDLQASRGTAYTHSLKKPVADFFFQNGVIIRPLGNVLYFMPPYCTGIEEIETLFRLLTELPKQPFLLNAPK